MGLFDLFFGGKTTTGRRNSVNEEYRAAMREIRKQKSKLYRSMRMAVIFVAVMAVALLVLAFIFSDLRSEWSFKIVFIMFALSAGGGMTLPWITQYERERKKIAKGENIPVWHKYVIFAFWGLIGISTLLWVISVFVVGDGIKIIINGVTADGGAVENYDFAKEFIMLRVSIIMTMQVAIGSVVATSTMRFGKNYLLLRIIMYVTLLYLDGYLSWVISNISYELLAEGDFTIFENQIPWAMAILMAVALVTSSAIFSAQTRRKEIELIMKGDVKSLTDGDVDLIDAEPSDTGWGERPEPKAKEKPADEKDPEAQLAKIKELLDKGIITEEEYQAKRKDIIDKM